MSNIYPSDFIQFENSGVRLQEAYITISKNKTLTLSAGFLRGAAQEILNNKYTILFYSKSTNMIAMKFTNDTTKKGIMKITSRNDAVDKITSGATIALTSFLTTHKDSIKFDEIKGKKFIAELADLPGIGKAWVVNLNK